MVEQLSLPKAGARLDPARGRLQAATWCGSSSGQGPESQAPGAPLMGGRPGPACTPRGCAACPPAWLTARAAPVCGPPRHLRSSSHPPHVLYPAYTLYEHSGAAALSHLFRVASSLDSMVLGEAQVLGQVKDALEWGQGVGTVRGELSRTFAAAFRCAKRVRTETAIGLAATSMAVAADEQGPPFRRNHRYPGTRSVVSGRFSARADSAWGGAQGQSARARARRGRVEGSSPVEGREDAPWASGAGRADAVGGGERAGARPASVRGAGLRPVPGVWSVGARLRAGAL